MRLSAPFVVGSPQHIRKHMQNRGCDQKEQSQRIEVHPTFNRSIDADSQRGDGAQHAWAILALLVKRLRQTWPGVKIIFRSDSGFCRPRMLSWCERNDVGYIVGIAKNKRLKLLKVGAVILRNTRRIRFLLSSACPYQKLFFHVAARLAPG